MFQKENKTATPQNEKAGHQLRKSTQILQETSTPQKKIRIHIQVSALLPARLVGGSGRDGAGSYIRDMSARPAAEFVIIGVPGEPKGKRVKATSEVSVGRVSPFVSGKSDSDERRRERRISRRTRPR